MPQTLRNTPHCARLLTAALLFALPQAAAAQEEAKLELGKQIFTESAEPQCMICHTLEDAGATGEIGPNLDDLKPTEDRVKAAVTGGVGVMPAYGETLSEEQIAAVAHYVASVAGK